MAFTFKGTGSATTTWVKSADQSSLVITSVTTAGAVGDLAVVCYGIDNNASVDGDENAVSGIVDNAGGAGNTWVKGAEWTVAISGPNAGTTCGLWYCQLTAALAVGSTITLSFNNPTARDATSANLSYFTVASGSTVAVEGTPGTRSDPAVGNVGSLDVTTANIACLRVRAWSIESNGTTAVTKTAAFNGLLTQAVSLGGAGGTNQSIRGEYCINTGTGQASAPTCAEFGDTSSVYVAFKEVAAAAAAPFVDLDRKVPSLRSLPLPQPQVGINPNLFKNPVPNNQTDWAKPLRVPHITPDSSVSLNPNLFKNPVPLNQTDWSDPRGLRLAAPDASRSLNPNLPAVAASLPFNQYDWTPSRWVPHVPGRTYNAVLYEVTVVAAPFNQTDWPPARRLVGAEPVPDGLNLNLFTNPLPFNQVYWPSTFFPRALAQPPAGFNPNLDPMPFLNQGPVPVLQRSLPDDVSQPYNQNLYTVAVAAGPFNQTDFARPYFPHGLEPSADSLNINLFTNAMPFSQFDWSKPQQIRLTQPQPQSGLNINLFANPVPVLNLAPAAPFAVRALPTPSQAYNLNLYGVAVVTLPLKQFDFAKPFFPRALPPPPDPLNLNLFTNPVPLNQTDWSRPANRFTQPFPQLGLNINLFSNPVPFAAADSSSRRLAPSELPDQPYNAALYTITVAALPFTQPDAPPPRRPLAAASLPAPLNLNLFRNDEPIANADSSTPMRLRAALDPPQPLNLNLFGILVPLNQFDFAAVSRPRSSAGQPSAFNPNLQTNPLPFNQFDHSPAHRVPAAPVDLSRSQPNQNIFTNPVPFLQSGVGIARSLRGTRPFEAINVALLGTPAVTTSLPFNQYNFTPAAKPQPQRRQDLLNPTLIASFVPPPPDAEQHSKPFFATPGRLMNI